MPRLWIFSGRPDQGNRWRGREGLIRATSTTWAVFAIVTLNSIGWSATIPFLAVYLSSVRDVPLGTIGATYLVAGLMSLVSQLVGGRWIDTVGPRRVMLVGSFFAIASALALSLLISTGADTAFILVAYPAFNFLRGIAQPASSAVVAHHEIKNLSTGLSLLSIAGNLGFAIGPILGGYLAQTIDYSSVFLFSAAVPVVTSAIAALAIRGGLLSGKKMSDAVSRPRLRWGADRNLMIFLALTLCGYLVLGYEIAPISVYVRNFLGFSPEEIGYLFATNGIVIVILQLPMSTLFFKMRRLVYPLIAGCGLATLSFLVAGVSSTFLEFDLMMVILTLGEILITVPSQTVVTLFSTAESRGTFQGYYSAASIGGRSLAALVGLYSFQVLARTPSLGWYAIGILSAVLALGFYAVSGPLQRDYATQGTQEVRPGAFS